MTYAVIGAGGFVGRLLWEHLRANHPSDTVVGAYFATLEPITDMEELDIRDQAAVDQFFGAHQPTMVYLPAGIPNVEWIETHADEAARTNVEGTRHVVEAAKRGGAKLIFFSTDYVFDGKAGPYAEDAATNPLNEYGRQKLRCEQLVLEANLGNLVARITTVYDWDPDGKNFVMQLVNKLGSGERMKVPSDQWATPVFASNLTELLDDVVTNRDASGVLHVAPDDFLPRDEFARKAAATLELDATLIDPVSTESLGQAAERPLKAGLTNERLKSLTSMPIVSVDDGLARVAAQYHVSQKS